jgi:hypothetical protein
MLATLYTTLKVQLLALEGMQSQAYRSASGSSPRGGIEEFQLHGRYFAGLRLTEQYLMVYVGPVLEATPANSPLLARLQPVRSGKGCLKVTKPEKLDMEAVKALLIQAASHW